METAYPFLNTDGGRSASRRPKQRNDCTVRALSLVTGVPYDEAYDYLAKLGRRCGRGTTFPKRAADDTAFGFRFRWVPFPAVRGQRRMNPMEFTWKFRKGVYICRTAGHVFAVIDGVVMDTSPPSEDRCIYGAWEVTK